MKRGIIYILKGAPQYGYTRDGVKILIPTNSKLIKIRDTFADRIKLRNMFILHIGQRGNLNDDIQISIDQSIIDRYFEVTDNINTDISAVSDNSSSKTYFCILCGAFFTDYDQFLMHQAMHMGLETTDQLIEYCALKHAVTFFRKAVNLNDSDYHREMYSKAKISYDNFVKENNVSVIKLKKR